MGLFGGGDDQGIGGLVQNLPFLSMLKKALPYTVGGQILKRSSNIPWESAGAGMAGAALMQSPLGGAVQNTPLGTMMGSGGPMGMGTGAPGINLLPGYLLWRQLRGRDLGM